MGPVCKKRWKDFFLGYCMLEENLCREYKKTKVTQNLGYPRFCSVETGMNQYLFNISSTISFIIFAKSATFMVPLSLPPCSRTATSPFSASFSPTTSM